MDILQGIKAIGIGGSWGALAALKELARGLPSDFGAPIFVVLHVGQYGLNEIAPILDRASPLHATTATDGGVPQRGVIYVAPADSHLLVIGDQIRLGRGPRENMCRPAIDPLLRSLAVNYGSAAIGVVLSGMLNDGAAGLAALKQSGGTTIVQNPTDSEAPSMPQGALRSSDVDYRAPAKDLSRLLLSLVAQPIPPREAVSPDIRLEVDIALGRKIDSRGMETIARPVALTCPSCGGVLSQIKQEPPLRFRCQVGHAFSADVLAAEQEQAVDEAIRIAMRVLDERARLIESMAEESMRCGRTSIGKDFQARAQEYRSRADVLRKAGLAVAFPKTEIAT